MRFFWIPVLILSAPLFFYKLGSSSLVSFDEAWYAAVARNIRVTKDPFNLYFNDGRFADHPPAGFWLISLSQTMFGDNEFGSRASSAILGLSTLIVIFLLGTKVSSPIVGLASSIALASSPWFIFRARSGNLDVPLMFFFVLSFLLALKASENKRWLTPLGLSLAFLFLTKTMVPFMILPALFIIFFRSGIKPKDTLTAFIVFLLPVFYWFISQLMNYPGFIGKYLTIGIPKTEKSTSLWQNIVLTKTYLHESIGSWFRPILALSPFSLFITDSENPDRKIGVAESTFAEGDRDTKPRPSGRGFCIKNKAIFAFIVFVIVFLLPFAFSSRGQIWHLLPVQPFLLLLMFSGLHWLLTRFLTRKLASSLLLTFTFLTAFPQIARNWTAFVDIPAYVSDEAILSKAASTYPYPLYIDDRFLPTAVYYSGKVVIDTPTPQFSDYFDKSTPILLITHSWRLDSSEIPKDRYRIIETDRDKLLLLISPREN
jgi:4-amino-4-deoxy-L-arabinose transferase-like glycosyltransferase